MTAPESTESSAPGTANAGSTSTSLWHRGAARIVLAAAGLLAGIGVAGWLGLQVEPDEFPRLDIPEAQPLNVSLPDGLPPPVVRFYRALYDDDIPVISGAVISGRGTMRISGITLPVRFRFVHESGEAYRHQIEATWFGRTILTVDERFADGTATLKLPFGTSKGPKIDQAANLTLWAEMVWMAAVWLTDDRVRWESLDEQTATLLVPFGEDQQSITVHFDPDTHLITHMESMRFQNEDSNEPTLWTNTIEEWAVLDGSLHPKETAVSWSTDEPWAVLTTDSVIYTDEPGVYLDTSD